MDHLLRLKLLDRRVYSKITLTVGRLVQNLQWLKEQLRDENPRVRANAVEALWGVRMDGLEDLLLEATRDSHNRVIANAAVGLYKLRNPKAATLLHLMIRHPVEVYRRSAAWAISQTSDTRFLETLGSILAKENLSVEERTMAERAFKHLQQSLAIAQFADRVEMEVVHSGGFGDGTWVVRVACLSKSGGVWLSGADVSALDFVIQENGQQIEQFNFRRLESRGSFSAVIVVPASWSGRNQLLQSLWRDPQTEENFAFLPYQSAAMLMTGSEDVELRFSNSCREATEYFEASCRSTKSLDHAIMTGIRALESRPGWRHLFVLVDPSFQDKLSQAATAYVHQAGIRVHSILWNHSSSGTTESLRQLAFDSGGKFVKSESAEALFRTIRSVRAAHFGSCELSWETKAESLSQARITYASSCGYGEVAVLPGSGSR